VVPSVVRCIEFRRLVLAAAVAVAGVAHTPALAQNAAWKANPGSNDFNTGSNWTGGTRPTGTATFGQSNTTTLSISRPVTTLDTLKFTGGAPAYTFNIGVADLLQLTGSGIVNNSANAPTFNLNGGGIFFRKNASAGNANINLDNFGLTAFIGNAGAGNSRIVLTNGSGLQFVGQSHADDARIIIKSGSSALFGAQSDADHAAITVKAGSGLGFFAQSTAGNATVHAAAGGTVLFFDRATGGDARFIADRTALIDFSASFGQNGIVSAGSIEGDGVFLIGNNFQVGSNNLTTEVTGRISECGCVHGALTKVGTGTLVLSGVNSYTGGTTVRDGTLQVDGSITRSSVVRVEDGGTLSGTGKVSDVVVKSGGTLAPGDNVGTLKVKGDLTFGNGSYYAVDVSPKLADRTDVTGKAKLDGTVLVNVFGGQYLTRDFTILSATGGRTGRFDDIDMSGPSGFNATLSYTSTDVILHLAAMLGGQRELGGNQSNVSNAINDFFNNGGALPPAFVGLFALSPSALAKALNQISGETATTAPTVGFQSMNIFLNAMLNPFAGGMAAGTARGFAQAISPQAVADANSAYAMMPRSTLGAWSLWATSYGGKSYLDGDAGAGTHSVNTGAYGVVAGADYRAAPDTWLGFAVSGGGNNWDVSNGLGSGDANMFQIGAYGVRMFGPAYVSGALGFGWNHVKTDRTVTIAGTDKLEATFDAQNLGARIEGGYRIGTAMGAVTPYVALQAQNYWLPSYGETASSGAPTFALGYASQSVQALRTELGSWFETTTALTNGTLALRGRVAWAHDETNGAGLTTAFRSLPGSSFVVTGAEVPSDSALLSGAAEWRLPNNLSVSLRLDSELASTGQTYAATAELRKSW
jgi:autotransporter-associated beta strand protein